MKSSNKKAKRKKAKGKVPSMSNPRQRGANRSGPVSPFSNPLHHGRHPVDPAVAQRLRQLEQEYANPATEPLPGGLDPNPVWSLDQVLGSDATNLIQQTGQLAIHIVGDTGFNSYPIRKSTATVEFGKINPQFQGAEENVIAAMIKDCDPNDVRIGPAFFLHLGDVIYFDNTETGYASQFYEPFALYPRKIVAIPGNHDCEVRLGHEDTSLEAFVANFCNQQPCVPSAARYTNPPREMLAQPNVYWRLDTPFVQIIGLDSNVGEKEGALRGGNAGEDQYTWLASALRGIDPQGTGDTRRAFVVAVHHPPYSQGNHTGSANMNADLDAAFDAAGVWPDAVLAAHDHCYQRFTRIKGDMEIPYIVAGGGGRYFAQQQKNGSQAVPIPGVEPVCTGEGNGYLIMTARPGRLTFEYHPVDNLSLNDPDSVLVDLSTRKLRQP